MAALSDYLEQKLMDLICNKDAFTGPATYLSLYTDDPGDDDSGTEVTGGSYARVLINDNGSGSPDWTVAAVSGIGYECENDDDITFTTATGSWGTVTHFGIHDAASSGNLLMHGALDESKAVGTDDVFKVSAGNLKLRLE